LAIVTRTGMHSQKGYLTCSCITSCAI
jgi:hypothetical protein